MPALAHRLNRYASPRKHRGYRRVVRRSSWGRSLYNYFRDYDPQVGRYAESDPIGLRGGSYSTYAYVGGKPVSNRDATGRLPDPLEVIAGAIAGGIGGYVADGPRGAAIGAIAGAVVAVVTPLESESAGAASAAFLRDRFIRGVTENVVGQALGQADCGKVPTLFTIDWFQAAASGAGGASAETWAAAWGGVAPFTAQAFGALAGGAAEYDYATYLGSSF